MSRCHNWPEIGHSTTNVWSVSESSIHCPANVLLNIMLHYNSTENPKIRQFSFYLQLWAKVNVSPGCRVRLIQSNGQKIIWGPRGRGLCKLLPCSPTSLFISNPKLENITKNITAYSNKWLHFGNNGSAGPDSASNGQRVKYKNPVTLNAIRVRRLLMLLNHCSIRSMQVIDHFGNFPWLRLCLTWPCRSELVLDDTIMWSSGRTE